MHIDLVHAAAALPAPWFVLIVAAIVFISTSGVPVPISVALIVSGALTIALPHGRLVWLALLVSTTLALSARDMLLMWLSGHSARLINRWRAGLHRPLTTSMVRLRHPIRFPPQRRPAPLAQLLGFRPHRSLATLEATCTQLLERGWFVIAVSRLSPLASPLDIAAGVLGYSPLTFARGIIPGRIIYSGLLLSIGALSGRAFQGGNVLQTVAILSGALIVVMAVLPNLTDRVIRRVSKARRPEVARITRSRQHATVG